MVLGDGGRREGQVSVGDEKKYGRLQQKGSELQIRPWIRGYARCTESGSLGSGRGRRARRKAER